MKRFFTPLMLSLFFFIPKVVFGATYTINLRSSDFEFYEDHMSDVLSAISAENITTFLVSTKGTYISTNVNYNLSNWPTASYSSRGIRLTISSYYNGRFTEDGTYYYATSGGGNLDYYFSDRHSILYASQPIYFSSTTSDIYLFVYGEHTYQVQQDVNNQVPTIAFLYNYWELTPPPPSDNTPLLTSFYSVVIDKLGEICTFFTSNYLYLSVFVIFLFYITILLLRRFIK